MAQWYVKELCKLTQVSVQTLHHYDRISLLKPSVRLPNGYRLYSEKDLLKLQQIIALKFFGFDLSQIKKLLSKDINLIDHLSAQAENLEKQANTLFEASQTLKNIISSGSSDKSVPWEAIIKSIDVYRAIQQLEHSWEGKVFNSEELKQYALFEQKTKNRFTKIELNHIENEWQNLINEVNANLHKDPKSQFGIEIGKRAMDWVNHYYGKEHIALRNAIWEKGFKEGQIDQDHVLSQETFTWLDNAITAYYLGRISAILNQIKTQPDKVVLQQWEELLIDMHGDEQLPKDEIFNIILSDKNIDQTAKTWVKQYMKKMLNKK